MSLLQALTLPPLPQQASQAAASGAAASPGKIAQRKEGEVPPRCRNLDSRAWLSFRSLGLREKINLVATIPETEPP